MDHLERLWIEIFQGASGGGVVHGQFVYDDILAGGDSHRLWNSTTDDSLRRVISSINSKLNDVGTREYGIVALCRFIEQIDPSRLVAVHEGLTSSLHLSLKSLEVETTHQFLAKILQHCRKIPELNQVVTSAVVPKVLSSFCDSSRTASNSELNLIWVSLKRYHGPCGNQRQNLERKLVTMLDVAENAKQLEHVCRILPLISSAGGGGSNGLKHSEDWVAMTRKVIASTEECLVSLLGDIIPKLDNDSTAARLDLPACKEVNVFQRMTFTKNRLLKLTKLLGYYLSDPFPSPKPVAMKLILNLIRKMLILDPLSILKSYANPPREYIYLAMVIPDFRSSAYSLLQCLNLSVGSNIITEASTIEELTLQELKWMSEKPEAFGKLKIGLYLFILSYLESTRNMASVKTVAIWSKYLVAEIEIKRKTFELNQGQAQKNKYQSKRKGLVQVQGKSKGKFVSTVIGSSEVEQILPSNPEIATLALKILGLLMPSMDATTHKVIHTAIGRLAVSVVELESYPSPYDNPTCRQALYGAVLSLIKNPHPQSPVSLSFFIQLLSNTEFDQWASAKTHGMKSWLERIVHPIGPTLNFPVVLPSEARPEPESESEHEIEDLVIDESEKEEMVPLVTSVKPTPSVDVPEAPIVVEESDIETVDLVDDSEEECTFTSALSSPQPPQDQPTLKRKYDEISEQSHVGRSSSPILNGHKESVPTVSRKTDELLAVDGGSQLCFEAMICDFVEI